MNKRHYEHTLPNIRGSLSNTYSTWNERKPSVQIDGWNEIKMYHKKELLQ